MTAEKAVEVMHRVRVAALRLSAVFVSGEEIRILKPPNDWEPDPFDMGYWKRGIVERKTGIFAATWKIDKDKSLGAHIHDVHESFTVLSGRMVFNIAGELTELQAGESIIVPSFAYHLVRYPEESVVKIEWFI